MSCSDHYIGVDLNSNCISACQERFADVKHAAFYANDGKSLAMVEDSSVDFAFSFDSLVHAEMDVIEAYCRELSRKLSPSGVAFIHHSNLGANSQITLDVLRCFQKLSSTRPITKKLWRTLAARGLNLSNILSRE